MEGGAQIRNLDSSAMKDITEKRFKLAFNPTISFDGVAIITATICASLWFGELSARVKQNTDAITRDNELITTLAENQRIQGENLAVLTTLVNERTVKKQMP